MSEDLKPYRYEPIALSSESTVVAEFRGAAAAGKVVFEIALIKAYVAAANTGGPRPSAGSREHARMS